MPTTLTDKQTIIDFVTGLAFLGAGGGAGRIEDALEMLEPVLKTGLRPDRPPRLGGGLTDELGRDVLSNALGDGRRDALDPRTRDA